LSANPSPDVIQFPVRTNAELAAESSDRILLRTSMDWVLHFATFANRDTAHGMHRQLKNLVEDLERRHGFGVKK
jgi:hypothetical protein